MSQGLPPDPVKNALRRKRIGDAQRGKPKASQATARMKAALPDRHGKNNSNWKGVLKMHTCETCQIEFLGKYAGKNRFCSKQCKWDYQRTLTGIAAYNYKNGDYTAAKTNRRNVTLYIRWRKEVLARDHYKCVLCGNRKELHCDHIKPYKDHRELRYDVDNGRTLCKWCHYEITFRKSPLNNWEAYSRWAKVTRGKPTGRLLQPQRLSEETDKKSPKR